MRQGGQAVLESLLCSLLLFALITGVFQIGRLTTTHLWLQHKLYAALGCLEEGQPEARCRTFLKEDVLLKGLGTEHLMATLQRRTNGFYGEILWRGRLAPQVTIKGLFSIHRANKGVL